MKINKTPILLILLLLGNCSPGGNDLDSTQKCSNKLYLISAHDSLPIIPLKLNQAADTLFETISQFIGSDICDRELNFGLEIKMKKISSFSVPRSWLAQGFIITIFPSSEVIIILCDENHNIPGTSLPNPVIFCSHQ